MLNVLRNKQRINTQDVQNLDLVEGTGIGIATTYDSGAKTLAATISGGGGAAALSALASAGVTSVTMTAAPGLAGGYIVVDPYTLECEVRRITTVVGSTVNFTPALAYTHSAGDSVLFWPGGPIPVRWFGAVGNASTDDTLAVKRAVAEAASQGTGGNQAISFSAGAYLISDTIIPEADQLWIGDGPLNTQFYLANGVDLSLVRVASQQKFYIENMGFRALDESSASHVAAAWVDLPLLDLASADLSVFSNIYVWHSPGDGIRFGGGDIGSSSSRLLSSSVIGSATAAGYLTSYGVRYGVGAGPHANFYVEGCDMETWGKSAIYVRGGSDRLYLSGEICSSRFEVNKGPSILLESGRGIHIHGNFSDTQGSFLYLDENSSGNLVEGNSPSVSLAVLGATVNGNWIVDAGFDNVIRRNDGHWNPYDRPFQVFFPSSRLTDPDSSWRTVAHLGTAGTGSAFRDFYRSLNYSLDSRVSRLPTRLVQSGDPDPTLAKTETVAVAAGDTYYFEDYWWSEADGGGAPARLQVKLQDNGTAIGASPFTGGDFHDSGLLSRYTSSGGHYREHRHHYVARIPSGVTVLRKTWIPRAGTGGAQSNVYLGQREMIKNELVNGGFDEVTGYLYAAGVADGWTVLSTAGAPTLSKESTIVKPAAGPSGPIPVLGGHAQRIVVAGNSTDTVYLSQAPTIDLDRIYLLRGWVYVTGETPADRARAVIGWGTDLLSDISCQFKISPNNVGAWTAVAYLFRPNSQANLIVGVTAGASQAVAYFDDFVLVPLKEPGDGVQTLVSPALDISTTTTLTVGATSIHRRVRRITLVCNAATGAGATVSVGIPGSAAYYGSWASAILASGDKVELTLSKTDFRPDKPIQVSVAAGGTGTVQVVAEVE